MKRIRTLTTILLILPIIALLAAYVFDMPLIGSNNNTDKIFFLIIGLLAASIMTIIFHAIYLFVKRLSFSDLSTIDIVKILFSLIFSAICILGWALIFVVTSN